MLDAKDKILVGALRKNLAARGLKAKVVEGDALKHVGSGALDVLVLDPPRAGAPEHRRTRRRPA